MDRDAQPPVRLRNRPRAGGRPADRHDVGLGQTGVVGNVGFEVAAALGVWAWLLLRRSARS